LKLRIALVLLSVEKSITSTSALVVYTSSGPDSNFRDRT